GDWTDRFSVRNGNSAQPSDVDTGDRHRRDPALCASLAGNPQSLRNERSKNACVRTNQHVPGIYAQHAMVNHLAFPERTPFGGLALAAAAPADRFKDFNCSQAAAQRLTPIAIKGKEVRSIDFELIDLALDVLEGVTFPEQAAERTKLARDVCDTIAVAATAHLFEIEGQPVLHEVTERQRALQKPRCRSRILTRLARNAARWLRQPEERHFFTLCEELTSHLVGDGRTEARANENVGSVRLNRLNLTCIASCDHVDRIEGRCHSVEA